MATIGILGSGTMGSGIAQVCAQRGFDILLYDLNDSLLDKARAVIEKTLNKGVELGKVTLGEAEATLGRIHGTPQLTDLAIADLVIEAVSEKMDLKRELFHQLDPLLKTSTLLASNTSSLSITAIS